MCVSIHRQRKFHIFGIKRVDTMECTNKYYDCIMHLRLGRGKKQTQNKSMAISGLQCRGKLVDPAGRSLQSLYAKQLAIYNISATTSQFVRYSYDTRTILVNSFKTSVSWRPSHHRSKIEILSRKKMKILLIFSRKKNGLG